MQLLQVTDRAWRVVLLCKDTSSVADHASLGGEEWAPSSDDTIAVASIQANPQWPRVGSAPNAIYCGGALAASMLGLPTLLASGSPAESVS